MINTVKGFRIAMEAELDVLEFSCLFYHPKNVANLIAASSSFSKSSLNIWKFVVHVLLNPGLKILSIALPECEMSTIVTLLCGVEQLSDLISEGEATSMLYLW